MNTPCFTWPTLKSAIDALPNPADVSVSVRRVGATERFSHRADEITTAASTIKVLILVALAQAIDAGRVALEERVPVRPDQRAVGSGILNELTTPLELSLAEYAHLMIAISDNTASNVVLDTVGMDEIAATASRMGLKGTALRRKFLGRLPDPGIPENLTTAEDLTTMLLAIAGDTAAGRDLCGWMRERLALQHFRNRLPRFLPDGVSFAGKSGSLDRLDHDSGLFMGPGGTLAMAVLHRNVRDPYAADVVIGTLGAAAIADANLAHAPS